MLSYFIVSILSSMGLSILFVEKGHTYPIRFYHVKFRRIIRNITKTYGKKYRGRRPSEVAYCSVCFSFWAALFVDLSLMFYSHFGYFGWPLSGFATAGITYIIFEFIGAISDEKTIRIKRDR